MKNKDLVVNLTWTSEAKIYGSVTDVSGNIVMDVTADNVFDGSWRFSSNHSNCWNNGQNITLGTFEDVILQVHRFLKSELDGQHK